jgi:hypothetical protein
MNDPLLVRCLERAGDLLRDWQGFLNRYRATSDPLREVLAFDEFHHERLMGPALGRQIYQAVDRGDVRMVKDRKHLGFALKACEAFNVLRD